jgi:hypothetical protein
MTAQRSAVLINQHPDFDLGAWRVFFLVRGQISAQAYQPERVTFAADPVDATPRSTANRRGYRCVFRLEASGALFLQSYRYDRPRGSKLTRQRTFHEPIEGDFFMVTRPFFFGPSVFVPFRGGQLVIDRDDWWHEHGEAPTSWSPEIRGGCAADFGQPISRFAERDEEPSQTIEDRVASFKKDEPALSTEARERIRRHHAERAAVEPGSDDPDDRD